MKIVNNKYIALTGLYKLPLNRYKLIPDLLYVILFTGIPTSIYAFFDRSTLDKYSYLDLNVIFLLVGLAYLTIYLKHLPKLFKIPGGKALIGLIIYLCFQIMYSVFVQEISLTEVLTIFRKNFFWPMASVGFLLYIVSIDIYRIERIFRIIFILTIITGILYVVSNALNIDFYALKRTKENLITNNVVYTQNLLAKPRYIYVLFVFAVITTLTTNRYNKHWQWLLGIVITIILVLRAELVVYTLTIGISITLIVIVLKKVSIVNNFRMMLVLFILGIIFTVLFPTRIEFLIEKIKSSIEDQYYYSSIIENLFSSGSLGYRIDLITDALTRSRSNLIFGNGYIRESTAGSYDFVLGLDTGIAPVIYCEGLIGMVIRWLPILVLLFVSLKNLYNKTQRKYILFYIAIITLIVPQFVNIIQTKIFIRYNELVFILMMLQILIYKDKLRFVAKSKIIK